MSTFSVNVKWGKQKFENVDIDLNESPLTFKTQLFSLTGVLTERQKLMIGGATINDDEWSIKAKPKIKQGCTFMLMGSADELPAPPKEKTKFIEDMSELEAASALELPFGLRNFGNTCYMNATLQCLRAIPELSSVLDNYVRRDVPETDAIPHDLTANMNTLFNSLRVGEPNLSLMLFLKSLHTAVPHFSEKDDRGVFLQQDAHECWSSILTNLNITLTQQFSHITLSSGQNFIQQFLGVKLQNTYNCTENDDEMETSETENSYQVSCFIEQEIKYLQTGIEKGLKGTVEKFSDALGRDASYSKVSVITRLPAYLTIQFVRFFHGRAGQSDELVAKKILKDVKFPLKLDMFEFCSSTLQDRMAPIRKKFQDVEEKKMALNTKQLTEEGASKPIHAVPPSKASKFAPYHFEDDTGSNNSGFYDLIGVLTHQGRSSSSGHYVSWIKRTTSKTIFRENQWFKYDDDDVTMVTDEDIKKLSGGGDWHTAYILLYGPRQLEILEDTTIPSPSK